MDACLLIFHAKITEQILINTDTQISNSNSLYNNITCGNILLQYSEYSLASTDTPDTKLEQN